MRHIFIVWQYWETNSVGHWTAFPDITDTFVCLSETQTCIPDYNTRQLQRCVILLYDRTSENTQVDQARKYLFAKGRQLDRIAPTWVALLEHVRRAAFQAGHTWGQSLVAQQQLPSQSHWGWTKDSSDQWIPF